jgi:hypothetical protein
MYVQDENVLGNPGVFGFIGKAITTVGNVLTGKTPIKLPTLPTSIQPQIIVQSPAPQVQIPAMPPWLLPVGLGAVALFILVPMLKRR